MNAQNGQITCVDCPETSPVLVKSSNTCVRCPSNLLFNSKTGTCGFCPQGTSFYTENNSKYCASGNEANGCFAAYPYRKEATGECFDNVEKLNCNENNYDPDAKTCRKAPTLLNQAWAGAGSALAKQIGRQDANAPSGISTTMHVTTEFPNAPKGVRTTAKPSGA